PSCVPSTTLFRSFHLVGEADEPSVEPNVHDDGGGAVPHPGLPVQCGERVDEPGVLLDVLGVTALEPLGVEEAVGLLEVAGCNALQVEAEGALGCGRIGVPATSDQGDST